MKVVFDTNVYVAEVLSGATAGRIIASVQSARWRVFISGHILDEFEAVMEEALGFSPKAARTARERALRGATMVQPTVSRHRVPEDPRDTPVLLTALAAGSDFLVTNDRHLTILDPYEGIRIVTMGTFRAILEDFGLFT